MGVESRLRARNQATPVTFTIQMQLAGACTPSSWLPAVVCAVTDCPDAPVSFTAGLDPGELPAGKTKTWNEGPEAGAGVHWNAQPMFHVPPATVKGWLVHVPFDCVGPSSTWAGPVGAVVAVDDVGAVVVVDAVDAVVVVDAVGSVVLPEEPDGGGTVYGLVVCVDEALPLPLLPSTMPTNRAATTAAASCHVRQDRRSLMPRSPRAGAPTLDVASDHPGPAGALVPAVPSPFVPGISVTGFMLGHRGVVRQKRGMAESGARTVHHP